MIRSSAVVAESVLAVVGRDEIVVIFFVLRTSTAVVESVL